MDKHKEQPSHWTMLDNDGSAKTEYKRNILKYFRKLISGMLVSVAGFSLLTIPSITPALIMLFLTVGLSGFAAFTTGLQKLCSEIKLHQHFKRVNKCANARQIEKLSKKELDVYNMLNASNDYVCKDKIPMKKVSKYYNVKYYENEK